MPAQNDHARTPEPSPFDSLFDKEVCELVNDTAPRPFAVVQQYGHEEDARVAAWGMAFHDHSEVTSVEGTLRISTTSAERAARRFDRKPHVSARLVWLALAGTATLAP
jgi:hypothetical protein